MTANDTGVSSSARDPKTGRFLTGNNGGGRPKGSRNKLGTAFIDDLYSEWQRSGQAALKRMAKDDPAQFVKVVAGILPRELDTTIAIVDSELLIQSKNFLAAYRDCRDVIGADNPQLIEGSAEDTGDPDETN